MEVVLELKVISEGGGGAVGESLGDRASIEEGLAGCDPGQEEHCASIARSMLVEAAKALSGESLARQPDPARLERLVARMEMLSYALASLEQRTARQAMESRVDEIAHTLERNDDKILSVVQRMAGTLTAMNARLQRLEEAEAKSAQPAATVPPPVPPRAAPVPPEVEPVAEPEPEPHDDDPMKGRISSALVAIAAALKSGPQAATQAGEPEDAKPADG